MAAGPLHPTDPRSLGGFDVVARLGEGGQGIVYEGWAVSGERVAIKVLKGGTDPDTRRRLARELAAAQRVAPFCTARVLAADLDRAEPYVVSEFVAGPSLHERVRAGGPLQGGDLDRLAVGTASALAAIHAAGIVHRDFKPGNVLLGPDGPRVVDFGIARPLDADTATSQLAGTPPYMAPEQLRGEPASPAADVFSWAATMAVAATGRAPFGIDTVAAVFHRILSRPPDLTGVPDSLRGTLEACLAKDPARRPTAKELMIRLVDPDAHQTRVGPPQFTAPATAPTMAAGMAPTMVAETAPTLAAEPGMPPAPRRPRRKVAALTGLVAVVVAAGLVYGTVLLERERNGGTPAAEVTGSGEQALDSAEPADSGSTGDAENAGGSDDTGASESAGASTAPAAAGSGVPQAFAGSWEGEVTSQDTRKDTYRLALTLEAGNPAGRMVRDQCDQVVQLTRNRRNAIDMTLEQKDLCIGGDITLTLAAGGKVIFDGQEGGSALAYRGELSRRP
ncbi:serine/threonine-protein kinase [Acrocarpospora catenulata]|uniref:serine/threonine-protein kinase n=1 Tax=Acrocarpospora catenulata TaxID=2836182 RepID=UPI001BD91B83|nr:serine/threonine-protein kinase [Acrocarpospora catenulata]